MGVTYKSIYISIPPTVARQRLDEIVPAASNTRNIRSTQYYWGSVPFHHSEIPKLVFSFSFTFVRIPDEGQSPEPQQF
jgi:hypothetical protein